MPRHDRTPTRLDPRELERATRAWTRYKRMMKWMVLLAAACAALALLWLASYGDPMPIHMVIATVAGVSLTVLVGTGLMGLVFVSNSSGHDDAASGGSKGK